MKSFKRTVLLNGAALAVAMTLQVVAQRLGFLPIDPLAAAVTGWGLAFLCVMPVFLSQAAAHEEEVSALKQEGSTAEIKEKFLSHVSHEFRSPLAAIIGYLDLMNRSTDSLSAKHSEYVRTMRDSAQRLKIFVDNIVDMSKLDAGVMEYAPEPVALRDALDEMATRIQPVADSHHIAIRVQCGVNLCATADIELLRKIFQQVLTNAINYTPDKGHITLWAKDGGENSILLGVTDSGIGIPRAMFDRVFEKFAQVTETKDKVRKAHGAGLGLSVAKRLVELQGGRIWIQSASKKGTTISWLLPKPTRKVSSTKTSEATRDRLAA